ICLLALLMPAVATAQERRQQLDDESFFELKVRPVLAGKCFKCHAGNKTSGGVRVDSRSAPLPGGGHGPAIVPGDVKHSLLIRAIQHGSESELKMPPGNKLAAQAIADLTSWVERGAPWPANSKSANSHSAVQTQEHWAFRPVGHPSIPA